MKFGDLFHSISNGKNIKQVKGDSQGLPISRIETISDGTVNFGKVGYADLQAEPNKKWLLNAGDILFSHINSPKYVGKSAIFEEGMSAMIHGMNLLRLAPNRDLIIPKYALYLIRSEEFRSKLRKFINQSVNQASVSVSSLKSIPVEIPSLREQSKIVLEKDLQNVIGQKREHQRELWAELEKSFFIDMFGNPFTNPKGLPMARLGDVAEIVTGNSPSRADESNFGSDIEWIKSNNLGGRIATEAEEWLSKSGKQKARIAPAGSVLVTCIAGSPESIGKCSLVDRDVAFNQQINAILPSENLSAEFILMQLKTFPELVWQKSSGGMKGLVSKSQFSEIEILNPDPILMKKFIDILQKEPGV